MVTCEKRGDRPIPLTHDDVVARVRPDLVEQEAREIPMSAVERDADLKTVLNLHGRAQGKARARHRNRRLRLGIRGCGDSAATSVCRSVARFTRRFTTRLASASVNSRTDVIGLPAARCPSRSARARNCSSSASVKSRFARETSAVPTWYQVQERVEIEPQHFELGSGPRADLGGGRIPLAWQMTIDRVDPVAQPRDRVPAPTAAAAGSVRVRSQTGREREHPGGGAASAHRPTSGDDHRARRREARSSSTHRSTPARRRWIDVQSCPGPYSMRPGRSIVAAPAVNQSGSSTPVTAPTADYGAMFALSRNRLVGSYAALTWRSRE